MHDGPVGLPRNHQESTFASYVDVHFSWPKRSSLAHVSQTQYLLRHLAVGSLQAGTRCCLLEYVQVVKYLRSCPRSFHSLQPQYLQSILSRLIFLPFLLHKSAPIYQPHTVLIGKYEAHTGTSAICTACAVSIFDGLSAEDIER